MAFRSDAPLEKSSFLHLLRRLKAGGALESEMGEGNKQGANWNSLY